MLLRIIAQNEVEATRLVETAITTGVEPFAMKQYRMESRRAPLFAVYIKGNQRQLSACKEAIIEQRFYDPEMISFRTARSMASLSSSDAED